MSVTGHHNGALLSDAMRATRASRDGQATTLLHSSIFRHAATRPALSLCFLVIRLRFTGLAATYDDYYS